MRILALETSARAVSAAVWEDGKILSYGYQDTGLNHSRTLMPIVAHILKNADMTPGDMDAFAVAAGPGSFTGIRIGVSACKGLAFGTGKPAAGVSTLAALARNVAFAGGLIICAMDARREQVYNALFTSDGENLSRLTEDRAVSLKDLSEELRRDGREGIVVGDGAALCAAYLREAGVPCRLAPPHLVMQSAASVAAEAAQAGKLVPPAELRPLYLRPPSALPLKEREKRRG